VHRGIAGLSARPADPSGAGGGGSGSSMGTIHNIKRHARPLARFGCASIGTVYVLVGVLALLALSGVLTGAADEDRMIHVLRDLPGGQILIWGIVAGMIGYIVWRTIEMIADPYEFGNEWRGIAIRTGIGLSALAYGLIAFSGARIALSDGGNGVGNGNGEASEQEQQLLVAQVLDWPAGTWIVASAGVLLILMAVLQFVVIVRRSYLMEIGLDGCSAAARRTVHGLAWYGYAARGVILAVLGYFVVRGAIRHDPSEVGDTDTAFDFIGGGTAGDTAFFIVAVGTIAYGFYMYACAYYYKFQHAQEAGEG
jgi:hypothetical protein